MKSRLISALLVATAAVATPAHATVLYANNFDSAPTVAAGVTATGPTNASPTGGTPGIATAGSWNASGWSGNFFVNTSTGNPATASTITLTGLKPNSAVKIGGVIGLLQSWDSTDGGCCAPDYLNVSINGNSVATLTANNALGSVTNLDGATVLAFHQQVDTNGFYSDTLGDLGTAGFANAFADASGHFTLTFQASGGGWQGGDDENWGLDNLSFIGTVGGVPEPATWAMMALGVGMAGAALRRRPRKARAAVA